MAFRLLKTPIAIIIAGALLCVLAILFLKPRHFLMGRPA